MTCIWQILRRGQSVFGVLATLMNYQINDITKEIKQDIQRFILKKQLTAILSAVSHSSSSRLECRLLAWKLTLVMTLLTSFRAFILPLNEEICSNLWIIMGEHALFKFDRGEKTHFTWGFLHEIKIINSQGLVHTKSNLPC